MYGINWEQDQRYNAIAIFIFSRYVVVIQNCPPLSCIFIHHNLEDGVVGPYNPQLSTFYDLLAQTDLYS